MLTNAILLGEQLQNKSVGVKGFLLRRIHTRLALSALGRGHGNNLLRARRDLPLPNVQIARAKAITCWKDAHLLVGAHVAHGIPRG